MNDRYFVFENFGYRRMLPSGWTNTLVHLNQVHQVVGILCPKPALLSQSRRGKLRIKAHVLALRVVKILHIMQLLGVWPKFFQKKALPPTWVHTNDIRREAILCQLTGRSNAILTPNNFGLKI